MPDRSCGASTASSNSQPETILAIDFGLRRMGIAAGQSVTATASPVASMAARGGTPDWDEFDRLIADWQPDRLVVGLPLNMDGSESEMSGRARRFARNLERRYERPVELTDERLTTREAKNLHPGEDDHAMAARLIAETWLGDRAKNSPASVPAPVRFPDR